MGLNRADRRKLAKAGFEVQEREEPAGASAFIDESYVPGSLGVVADEDPGPNARLRLQQFVGPVGPNLFMFCRTAALTPEVAVQIGEMLVAEGRRLKTGLVLGAADSVPNLREGA